VIKRIKRARLFVWLREHRHELFDQAFQQELARAYQASPKGQPPVPPAQLGLATVLQAYTGASDDEVIEACVMDRRWQLVLDCMDHATAPFSKGTLVGFRARLIEHGLDRRLVERTVELYGQATGRVAGGRLRAALDSSPLWGAGRVEDTINLLGHALRKVVGVLARQQGWGLAEGTRVLAAQAGVPELAASSLKAALDLDWDDPAACQQALVVVLGAVERVERFAGQFAGQLAGSQPGSADPRVVEGLQAARQVRDQDTIVGGDGIARIRQGVARDRRISIEDPQMRHGRKTKSRRIDGYKRHVLTDLDTELVPAVGVTLPTSRRPRSPSRSPPTWTPSRSRSASSTSTGPTCPAAWSATVTSSCRCSAKRSRSARWAAASPRPRSRSTSTSSCWSAPIARPWRLSQAARSSSPPTPARSARCAASAPAAPGDVACRSTPTSGCWPSSASASRPRKAAPSSASAPGWSTPWPTWAAGRAIVPATAASARTYSTYAGSRSSTTSTSSPANHPNPIKPPEPAT
jgi:Transposase domain (DUF772)